MYGTDQQNRGARRDARAVVLAMRPDIRPLPRSVPVRGTRCCPALQSPPPGQKLGCQGPRICGQSCHKSACSVRHQNLGRRIKRMVFFVTHESAYIVTVDITTHVHDIRIHPAAPPKFWTSSYIGHPGSGHHVDDTPTSISQTLEKGQNPDLPSVIQTPLILMDILSDLCASSAVMDRVDAYPYALVSIRPSRPGIGA